MRVFLLFLYFAILIATVICFVIFAQDNSFLINIKFFNITFEPYPLWLVLFFSFILGSFFTSIFLCWELAKLYLSKKELQNMYEKLKNKSNVEV